MRRYSLRLYGAFQIPTVCFVSRGPQDGCKPRDVDPAECGLILCTPEFALLPGSPCAASTAASPYKPRRALIAEILYPLSCERIYGNVLDSLFEQSASLIKERTMRGSRFTCSAYLTYRSMRWQSISLPTHNVHIPSMRASE